MIVLYRSSCGHWCFKTRDRRGVSTALKGLSRLLYNH